MNIKQVEGYPKIQPRIDSIPGFLRALPAANWIAEPKPGSPGKFNKAPRNPKTGIRVGANEPSNFGTFDDAVQGLDTGRYSGCGILLTADSGITGIDIDDVRQQDDPVKEWVKRAVAAGAYCEHSPSGDGLRLFVRGTLPDTGRKYEGLEVYNRDRFLTVTGASLNKEPAALIDGQRLIDEFLEFMPERPAKAKEAQVVKNSQTAAANPDMVTKLVAFMAVKEPLLHAGEWGQVDTGMGVIGYPSQSEADYAYTAVCVRKLDSMEIGRAEIAGIALEVFKTSGLYRNDRKALLAINKHIDALPERRPVTDKHHRVQIKLSDGRIQLSDIPPPPRKFVWDDLLPAGKATLLAGAGGVSKTQLGIQLMVCVAAGVGQFSRNVMMGSTLGVFAEDDTEELGRRINATVNTLNLSNSQKKTSIERIRTISMIGLDSRFTKPINGCLESTGFADEIVRLAEELATESGVPVRLIVIDHASLIHGGDFNSREDVAQTGRLINHIANVTGAAVLLLAHTRKGASTKDEEPTADDAAGSAAWSDLVRSVLVIRTMTEKEGRVKGVELDKRKEYASLTLVKANYAPPSSSIWLHRRSIEGWGVGVLTEVDLKPKAKPQPGCDWKLRQRVADLVKANQYLTQTKILRHSGKDGGLGASKHKVEAEIDGMLADGDLVLVKPTAEEKNQFGIRSLTAGFLRVGEKQS